MEILLIGLPLSLLQEFTTELLSDLELDDETIESARKAAAETAAKTVSVMCDLLY